MSLLAGPSFAKKKKAKPLPPGLQKKLDRGEPLPPGWQKKLARGEVLERRIYERSEVVVPASDKGIVTIAVEGEYITLYEKTLEIIDILERIY